MTDAAGAPFDDIRRLIAADAGAGRGRRRGGARARPPAHQAGRQSGTSRTFRRVARGLARQGHAGYRPSACLRLCRKPWRGGARRVGVSERRQPADAGERPPAAPRSTRSAPAFGLDSRCSISLDMPTGDIVEEPAIDEKACVATMAFGMEAIAGGTDLLCVGELGIGNTTIAAAIYTALFGARRSGGSGAARASTRKGLRARSPPWRRPSSGIGII